ncbi:MAG: hypothetical protein NW216_11655 [Hyphomicrobium sp.]|nr:hypothetical protein [Hyphomicrobium sp.]
MSIATRESGTGSSRSAGHTDVPSTDGAAPRDVKKLVLVLGLGALSWVATYVGMLELIEANMGDLPIIHKLIVGFSVAMLMVMIIWLLDQMFAPIPAFTKVVYAAGYIFLTIISVGFGFGFYWKVLESRAESSRSAEAAVSQVQTALYGAAARLDQLQATLVKLADVSAAKAEQERTQGTSCPNSRPGDGPRRKMRDEDAARFQFASDFVKGRASAVKSELSALDGDLAKIASRDPATFDAATGTRTEFMKGLSRKLDMTVTGFNAFRTDPQLRQLRTDLADRAERSTFGDPKSGGFICPDSQLQGALRGSVRAIDELPVLEKPVIASVEGADATVEAFRRLTATFAGLLTLKMPPTIEEIRDLQQKAVQSLESRSDAKPLDTMAVGLSSRDYVPLAVALFVDLCLLLVSMGRPVDRLGGLMPKMRAAEASPVSQILSRFNDIHRDPEVRQTFEVFRHVVFDQGGVYYVAVPLDAPYRWNPRNPNQKYGYASSDAEALQDEAHLLANLFTSFEKERIFARVYSPLLTTRAIQKKLARQGSKFAGCEAYRVYRFRDGAWPEIILGAVMGAAKRAEAARDATATSTRFVDPLLEKPDELATRKPSPASPSRASSSTGPGANTSPHAAARPANEHARRRAASTAPLTEPRSVDPDLVAKHGPYARFASADLGPGEETFVDVGRPANSNTAGAMSEKGGERVIALPRRLPAAPRPGADGPRDADAQPARVSGERIADIVRPISAEGTGGAPLRQSSNSEVDIVLSRETATFTVPLSDIPLPNVMRGTIPVSHATLPKRLLAAPVTRGDLSGMEPAIGVALPEPFVRIARVLGGGADIEIDAAELPSQGVFEAENDDAGRLAARLRPARNASEFGE